MLTRFLFLVLAVIFVAGCGIKAQTYVMTKDRVNIAPNGGNVGYLTGKGVYQDPEKKTRQVYVLEVSKPASVSKVKKTEETVSKTTTQAAAADQAENVPAPTPAASGSGESVTYTVQKDDTLQKIAKKFYGSYGKWTRVYEANKDKLKNPNFVRPGTVLTIPAGK